MDPKNKDPETNDPETPPKPEWTPPASQDELNRIIGARVAQERAQHPTADELAELRRKAGEFDALEDANRTELDRERESRQTAETAAQQATERLRQVRIEAAVMAAASGKAIDPAIVTRLVLSDPSYAVTIDDADQVTGAESAVASLIEKNPFLGSRTPEPNLGQGGAPRNPQQSGLQAGMELVRSRNRTNN